MGKMIDQIKARAAKAKATRTTMAPADYLAKVIYERAVYGQTHLARLTYNKLPVFIEYCYAVNEAPTLDCLYLGQEQSFFILNIGKPYIELKEIRKLTPQILQWMASVYNNRMMQQQGQNGTRPRRTRRVRKPLRPQGRVRRKRRPMPRFTSSILQNHLLPALTPAPFNDNTRRMLANGQRKNDNA